MGKSICCQADTRLGYYNADQRPDIHGTNVVNTKNVVVIGILGTYCNKCGKLCDYTVEGIEYFTNGIIKTAPNA